MYIRSSDRGAYIYVQLGKVKVYMYINAFFLSELHIINSDKLTSMKMQNICRRKLEWLFFFITLTYIN